MTPSLTEFFAAWAIEDPATRDAQIDATLGADVFYADPRTPAPIDSAEALKAYVGQFSQMAPGMPVAAIHESRTLHFARVAVQFGAGDQAQMGQYVADLDDAGRITRLVGFVGLGTPQ